MNRNDQQFMAQKIRTQYVEKQSTELDELRALDAKVKRPANVFAYTFGSISAIVMGSGMSLVMTDIGQILGIGSDGSNRPHEHHKFCCECWQATCFLIHNRTY